MSDNDKSPIEEMARHIPARIFACDVSENSATLDEKHREIVAEHLYRAGYRQQSGAQRQIPCEIGSKIYEVTGEPGERIDIDEYTVSEVGLNGVFTRGGWPCYRPHRHYFAYEDEGAWWFFKRDDAEAEKKRRDAP